MKILHKISILLIILIALLITACNVNSRYDSEFFAMDTVMTVTAYGSESEAAVKAVEKEINRIDTLFSVQNKNSDIYKLNKEKSLSASADTIELINRSITISSITDGAFDITVEPLVRAWGFYSGLENTVPAQNVIDNELKRIGMQHITINDSVVVLDKDTSVDLGAIAKGYASSRVKQILRDNNISSAVASIGGNVRTVGTKPDGSKWTVAIADPDDNSLQAGVISVSDKAVVTSGGYQRYFEKDGNIYHHIINPKTGYPANEGLKSVTVISDDDTFADALSTSLFVMGLEQAKHFCKQYSSDFDAVLISDDNKIYITENLKNDFSSQKSFEVITD